MKGLLRFQAVVLVRSISDPIAAVVFLVLVAGLIAYGATHGSVVAGAPVLAVAAFWGMNRTIEAVDAARWLIPVRRGDALLAHLGFWLTICTPPAALIALGRAHDVRGAAILFLHLSLFFVGAATLSIFLHLITRRGRGLIGVAAGFAVGSTLIWPAGWSFVLAWEGRWESLAVIGVVACICAALGVPMFLKSEFAPAASTIEPVTVEWIDQPRRPHAPTVAIWRAAHGNVFAWLWIAFQCATAIIMPGPFAFIWPALAATTVVDLGLPAWKWLLPSPIDRRRAFAVLFGPALAVLVAGLAARTVVVETATDRSAFFRDPRKDYSLPTVLDSLSLWKVLEHTPDGKSYERPQIEPIASKVRSHLHEHFALDVPVERISTAMARGWPSDPSTGIMDMDQTAVLDAMERVRVDLAPEIAGAARRRDCGNVAAAAVMFLLFLRLRFGVGRRRLIVVGLVALGLVVIAFGCRPIGLPPILQWFYVPFQSDAWPVTVLAYAIVVGSSVLLWRSSFKAFRRMEITDIRPQRLWTSTIGA